MSRLLHPPVIVAGLMLLLAGAAALSWLWLRDGRIAPMGLVVALLPLGLLVWGVAAGEGSRSQISISVWALAMFGMLIPAYYVFESGSSGWFSQWRFLAAFGIFYFVTLPIFMLWLASWTTRVPPAPGALPSSEQRLHQRIRSLADAGLELRIEAPANQPGPWLVTRDFRDGKRTIGVRLTFMPEHHCVLAREVSLIRGDAPMNASEAQMRSGPRQRDGTHPDAFTIYDARLTMTPPSEAIRHQIALRLTADHAEITGDRSIASAPANLPHLLTELVHQSGWTWQGVFFNWQGRCR